MPTPKKFGGLTRTSGKTQSYLRRKGLEEAPADAASLYTGHPWERWKGETSRSYHYFCTYRDAGPNREIPEIAKQFGKHPTFFRQLAKRYTWGFRVDQFDAYLGRKALAETERGLVDAARLQADKHVEIASGLLEAADLAIRKLKKQLKEKLTRVSPRGTVYLAVEAVKLQRLLVGESTDRSEVTGGAETEANADRITSVVDILRQVGALPDRVLSANGGEELDSQVDEVHPSHAGEDLGES